jgi:hypothetical protein
MAGTFAHAHAAASVRPVCVGCVVCLPYDNAMFISQT